VLTVVKVGGGIGDDALPGLCAALAELGRRHPLLVVPGGAWFADVVRAADRRYGLSAETAHRMAILGMEQFGWLLAELIPETPVLLPADLPLGDLPASWRVTSDSIAAWVAGRLDAGRLVLVKGVDGLYADWPPSGPPIRDLSAAELAALRPGGVDEHLPTLLEHARFDTWIVGGRDPARVTELLDGGTTTGTRIAAARLVPWRNE
jgi:5-(aminomethyl)-3-furanmethanol phosphate kinase